mmetsp:Transcript_18268/g.42669  ORF Transcript_18268/g.42669 Transcript_18268/m.42669 type:complete len:228 (+) Transcript_18268:1228-1911(+)
MAVTLPLASAIICLMAGCSNGVEWSKSSVSSTTLRRQNLRGVSLLESPVSSRVPNNPKSPISTYSVDESASGGPAESTSIGSSGTRPTKAPGSSASIDSGGPKSRQATLPPSLIVTNMLSASRLTSASNWSTPDLAMRRCTFLPASSTPTTTWLSLSLTSNPHLPRTSFTSLRIDFGTLFDFSVMFSPSVNLNKGHSLRQTATISASSPFSRSCSSPLTSSLALEWR